MAVTLYHNPRCSKSRQTLALLEERGIQPHIVLYLETPPDHTALRQLLGQLQLSARGLLRKTEDAYQSLGLDNMALDEEQLINAMVTHPQLIERPIVVNGKRAALGRPPENILPIL